MHGVLELDAGQRLLMIDEKADSEHSHEDAEPPSRYNCSSIAAAASARRTAVAIVAAAADCGLAFPRPARYCHELLIQRGIPSRHNFAERWEDECVRVRHDAHGARPNIQA
jgi:hypothetical protein